MLSILMVLLAVWVVICVLALILSLIAIPFQIAWWILTHPKSWLWIIGGWFVCHWIAVCLP